MYYSTSEVIVLVVFTSTAQTLKISLYPASYIVSVARVVLPARPSSPFPATVSQENDSPIIAYARKIRALAGALRILMIITTAARHTSPLATAARKKLFSPVLASALVVCFAAVFVGLIGSTGINGSGPPPGLVGFAGAAAA